MPIAAERTPFTLAAYQMLTGALTGLAPHVLEYRLTRGKENRTRIAERRGEPSAPRPPGPMVWIHGASVGELTAVIPLIERIRARGFTVLVTTGTVTSAALAERRLPAGAFHQFIPLDLPAFISRFLDYWRPDLALFVESDLWPNLILSASARAIPLILINGRLSERSFSRWRRLPKSIEALLRRFDLCLVRSPGDARRFGALGAPRITITGNLKFDVPPLGVDARKLDELTSATQGRHIILAASTHPGEESIIIDAHRRLKITFPDLLTVIAPRHPQRGSDIATMAGVGGQKAVMRSRGNLPDRGVDVFVFDTLGELGLVFRLAPIVFMGGSLIPHGGQNPIEPVKFGAAILHGPNVGNFADIYSELDRAEGAVMVNDAGNLTTRIGTWIKNAPERDRAAAAAMHCIDGLGGALDLTISALEPYFMQLQIGSPLAKA